MRKSTVKSSKSSLNDPKGQHNPLTPNGPKPLTKAFSTTPSPTTTAKRSMSQGSRRKQRSADQLLSRTGHAVPITTPSNKPLPQKTTKMTPNSQHFQKMAQPSSFPPISQSSFGQQADVAFGQQGSGGGDDWGFGGTAWSPTPQSSQHHQQSSKQHQQRSRQQQKHSPLSYDDDDDRYNDQQSPQSHRNINSTFPKTAQSSQNHFPSHNEAIIDSKHDPNIVFDALFPTGGDGGEDPVELMGSVVSPNSQKNPLLNQNLFKSSKFGSKLHGGSIIAPKSQQSQSLLTGDMNVQRAAARQQQNSGEKATSLFSQSNQNDDIDIKNDPRSQKVPKATSLFSKPLKTLHGDDDDADFNPITQLREQFNRDTGASYQDPMDIARLGALDDPQNDPKSPKILTKRDPNRTLITPSDQGEGDTDGSEESVGDSEHYDAYSTIKTVKTKKTQTNAKKSQKGTKSTQDLSEDESDPEGYMDLLRERADDDAAFEDELEEYYKKFPQHRRLAHTTRFARHNHVNGYGEQDFPKGQFEGEMDEEVSSDGFRIQAKKKKGKNGDEFDDFGSEFDGEMPSDMDDFSAFGSKLRGDLGDVDLTPDYIKEKQLQEKKKKKMLMKQVKERQVEEKKLQRAKLLAQHPHLVFSEDESVSENNLDDIDEGSEISENYGSEDYDENDENGENVLQNGENGQNGQKLPAKKKFRPLGLDNSFEIDGVRIPLRGLSKSDMEDFLRENARFEEEEKGDEEEEKEHLKELGFTPEELDADRPKRIDYYKLPTPDQIPLLDTNLLQFKEDDKSVLNWDVPWPEHTSTCDLSIRTCILGTPNAGKSVIVNNLTRTRVTAVSSKRNTTRRRVLGIATEGNAQMTLYDTPGINEIHDAKKFQRDLATEAWDAVGDADLALVVLDAAKRIGGPELFLLHKCSDVKTSSPHVRWVLALNKVDLVDPKDKLLDTLYRIQTLMPFDDCFMISGLDGDGVADLEHYLYQQAIPREWEHEREEKTDQTDVQLATELIRETLYHRLNKEIPYTVQQENVEWMPLKNGQLRIDQRLVVRRDQHKRILVGSNGSALRAITKAAEERLKTAFRRPISLNLRVSVSLTQDFDSV